MRDIKNTNLYNGDLNVVENTYNGNEEYKPFAQCSTDELLAELVYRKENILLEQNKKVKRLKPFGILAALMLVSTVCYHWFVQFGIWSPVLQIGSFASIMLTLIALFTPNQFQTIERNVVNEINLILKQRRVI